MTTKDKIEKINLDIKILSKNVYYLEKEIAKTKESK